MIPNILQKVDFKIFNNKTALGSKPFTIFNTAKTSVILATQILVKISNTVDYITRVLNSGPSIFRLVLEFNEPSPMNSIRYSKISETRVFISGSEGARQSCTDSSHL